MNTAIPTYRGPWVNRDALIGNGDGQYAIGPHAHFRIEALSGFPWPQSPTLKQAQAVAKAAVELRKLRREVMQEHGWSLRDLYRTLETPGSNPLRDAQEALDTVVRAAYGMKKSEDILAFLLKLNHEVADREGQLLEVTGPGLPPCVTDKKPFITKDCIVA